MYSRNFNEHQLLKELDDFIYKKSNGLNKSEGTAPKNEFIKYLQQQSFTKIIFSLSRGETKKIADSDFLYYPEIIRHLVQLKLIEDNSNYLHITTEGRSYLKNKYLYLFRQNIGLFAFALTIFSILINIWQIQNNKILESNRLMFDTVKDLRNEKTSKLMYAIAVNENPLLIENGGRFKNEELDNYLVKYELIYKAYLHKLITKDMVSLAFSYDLKQAYNNLEIKNYIKSVRDESNDTSIYEGFEKLADINN